MPPQNCVYRTIVDVSPLGVKLTYPDASLAVRPARNPGEEPGDARPGEKRKPSAHAKPIRRTVRASVLANHNGATEAEDAEQRVCYRHVLQPAAASLPRPTLHVEESAKTHASAPEVPKSD